MIKLYPMFGANSNVRSKTLGRDPVGSPPGVRTRKRTSHTQFYVWAAFALLSVLLAPRAFAQEFQIGSGTSVSYGANETPFGTLYEDRRVQFLYLASEISAAGFTAGPIDAVAFDVVSANATPMIDFTVRMGHTSSTELSSYQPTSVVRPAAVLTAVSGWTKISFSTPFEWNGVDNIIVEVCFDNDEWDGNSDVRGTSISGSNFGEYIDNEVGCNLTDGESFEFRPNIKFYRVQDVPACVTSVFPANGAANVTGNTISWAADSNAATYDVYFGTSANPPLVASVGATQYQFVPELGQQYYWKVIPKNSLGSAEGCEEFTFTAVSFAAPCLPNTTYGCTDGDVIARVVLNTLDNTSGTGCPGGSSGYSNYFDNPTLTTTLQAGGSYTCTVWVGQYTEGVAAWIDYNDDGLFTADERIGFSNGQISGSGVPGTLGSSAAFPISVSCSPPLGTHILRVRAMFSTSGSAVTACGDNSWGEVEDYLITITASDPCPQPKLLTASSVTTTSATLSWTPGCEETSWEVVVQPSGSGIPTGPGTVVTAPTFDATFASGSFEYYVRANCDENGFSAWSGPMEFTLPECVALLLPEDGATGFDNSVDLEWEENPSATSYQIMWGDSPTTMVSLGTTPGTTVNIYNLNYGTTYYWSVYPVNSNGVSEGCTVYSLTTMAMPAGNTCADAWSLDGSTSPLTHGTSGFTNDFDPTCNSTSTTALGPDRFYSLTVPAFYTATITTSNTVSGYDSVRSLLVGTCGDLTPLFCTDANDGTFTWTNTSEESQTLYYVQDAWSTAMGTYTLAWALEAPPIQVNSVVPESVCSAALNGAVVTLNGLHFGNVTQVTLNGEPVTFNVLSNTQIEVTLDGTATSGIFAVESADSSGMAAETFTVIPNPVVSPIIEDVSLLCVGGSVDLNSLSPGGQWSSSDESIATVNANGIVVGLAPGDVTIYYSVTENGCLTSVSVDLQILEQVEVANPTSATVVTGSPVSFTAAATGAIAAYQWQVSTDFGMSFQNLSNDGTYSGVNTNTLTIDSAQESMNYYMYALYVIAETPCGDMMSAPATLIVGDTGVAQHPENVTLCSGVDQQAQFTVVGSGADLTYSWEMNNGLEFVLLEDGIVEGLSISGSDTPTLTVGNIDAIHAGYSFRAIVNGVSEAYSNEAFINLVFPTEIVSQTEQAVACYSGSTVVMSVTATGGISGYSWEYSPDGLTFAPVANNTPLGVTYANANTAALTIITTSSTPLNQYYYRAVVSGSHCEPVTSNVSVLSVEVPQIASHPQNTTASNGTSAVFSVGAEAGSTYQWQYATSAAGPWNNVQPSVPAGYSYSGQQSSELTVALAGTATASSARYYRALVTSAGCTVASNPAQLTVVAYCSPAPTSVDGSGITNVTMGSINNTTGVEANNFGNYTHLSTDVVQNSTVNFSVRFSTGWTYGLKVWIDFNQDGDFTDAGEQVYYGLSASANPTVLSGSFQIPLSAATGATRIRFGSTDTDSGPSSPCYTGTWGAFEDYTLNILPAPVCEGMPSALVASTTVSQVCQGSTISLSATPPPAGFTGFTFQWHDAQGPIAGATSLNYTTPALTGDASYFIRLSCAGSGLYSDSNTISLSVAAPEVLSTAGATACGYGELALSAEASAGASISWYATSTSTEVLAQGNTFTTPGISETTSYWVEAKQPGGIGSKVMGAGSTTSSSSGSSPFYHGYGGQKAQYIYKASELTANGFSAGPIYALSFEVSSLGTTALNGFSIRLGHTTQEAAAANTAITGLTSVYNATTRQLTSGVNKFNFTQPFMWNGTSNLVVEVVYSNNNTGGVSSSVRVDNVGFNSTLGIYADNASATAMLNATSSTGLGSVSGNTTTGVRPKTIFDVTGECKTARVEVIATITEAPEFALSDDKFTMCEGATSDLFTITTGMEDYDTFVWSPTAGVSGDAASGYVFNPTVSTVYTLTASNDSGCSAVATVNITINPLPAAITAFTPETPLVCSSGAPVLLNAIGAGLGDSIVNNPTTSSSSSPYRGNYTAHKNQSLYTAAELTALGFQPGQAIYGLGYDVTSFTGSPYTFANFTIGMKHTTASTLTALQTGMTTVLSAQNYTLSGTAPFTTSHTFDTPFIWDGTSNIVVETCFRNTAWVTEGLATIAASNITGFNAYFAGDGTTALTVCSAPGTPTLTAPRPNVRFMTAGNSAPAAVVWSPAEGLFTDAEGTVPYTGGPAVNVYAKPSATTQYTTTITTPAGCSVSNQLTVTVLDSDPVVLSQDSAAYCVGASASVQIVSGAEGYDSFVWSPATGVSGDPVSGYVFNAAESTVYTLTASNEAGCEFVTAFTLTVNPMPSVASVFPQAPVVCSAGPAQALSVTGGTTPATIALGTGTSTNTDMGHPAVYGAYYENSRNQFLIRASELTALGLTANTPLTSISFYVQTLGTSGVHNAYTIKIGHTTANALTVWQTASTQVYGPVDYQPVNGLNTHQFNAPFVWDGSSNIVVEVCHSNDTTGAGNYYTRNAQTRYTTTPFVSTRIYRVDDASACGSSSSTTSLSQRPNIVWGYSKQGAVTWAPTQGLFSDAGATVPYAGGTAAVVYAMPEEATTYTATVATPEGCSVMTTFDVAIQQATEWFVDEDGDGYGNSDAETVFACEQPEGYAAVGGDCNDEIAAINPGRNEVLYNGIDDNCNGELDEGFQILSQVKPAQCGTTLQNIYTSVVLVPKTGATAYRIKVVKVGEPETSAQIIERDVAWFNMTMLGSYDYASTYDISVEVQRNGIWLGYYGPVCQVSTPAILDNGSLVVNPTVCGQTLEKIYHSINGTPVSGATGYRFRITDLSNDPHEHTVQTIDRPAAWFSLDMLARYNYGTTYAVEIAVKTTGDYTGYSAPCTVTTPAVSTLVNCGTPESPAVINLAHTSILAQGLSRVTMYRYQVTDMSTFETQIIDRGHWFTLNNLEGLAPGSVYRVRVAVMTAGTWSVFGEPCYVSFQPGAAMRAPEAALEAFTATAAPSPFANDFGLNIKGMSANVVTVSVYDMIGKLLEQRQIDPTQIEATRFGERFPAGVYNVVISQDENVKTLRVIKR